jgi:hypothetical protein
MAFDTIMAVVEIVQQRVAARCPASEFDADVIVSLFSDPRHETTSVFSECTTARCNPSSCVCHTICQRTDRCFI